MGGDRTRGRHVARACRVGPALRQSTGVTAPGPRAGRARSPGQGEGGPVHRPREEDKGAVGQQGGEQRR